jgi:hypothetical protein
MSELNEQEKGESHLNIELSEKIAEGIYSNLVMIAHSPEEFIFDFIRVMPGVPKARVKARVIVTPQHARRLLNALTDNIDRYEAEFGPIGESNAPQPIIQFQLPGGEA